mgnify:CR=1 FL=1
MWTVLKFDKKNLALLKEDLTVKLGKEFKKQENSRARNGAPEENELQGDKKG